MGITMTRIFTQSRLLLTALVSLYIVAFLLWQHSTTGVPAHHLLHDPELPAISNWWGLLILPLATWCLTTLINKKYGLCYPKKVWLQLGAAGLYALIMTLLFYAGYMTLVSLLAVPFILFVALFFPVYQAPFLLAYVVVSSAGFGAFIPTLGGFIFAAMAYVTYHFIRPIPLWLFTQLTTKNT